MPHIHTKPGQHDLTVSAFIIRTDDDIPKAMVHKHKKLNLFLQFGGHVELHENPWDAIVHEIREETGYRMTDLKLLQPKDRIKNAASSTLHPYPAMLQTHPFGDTQHHHTDIAFAFVASHPPKAKPSQGESNQIRLIGVDELLSIEDDEIPENVRLTFQFAIETCLANWEQIPANSVA